MGSSVNIEKRWAGHRHLLRNGKSTNKILLFAWMKYGEDAFLFEVVEECAQDLLIEREQHHMDIKSEYNSRKVADSNYGRVIGMEEKMARSEAMKERHLQNPELAISTRKRMLELWGNEHYKVEQSKRISHAAKKSWSDPDNKKERLSFMDKEYRQDTSMRTSGSLNPRHDANIFEFHHDHLGAVSMTKYDFYTKFNLDKSHVTKLCNGKLMSHKGWRLKEKAPEGA